MPRPQKNHDLRLPDWGPYTKRYTGISHIPDLKRGLRFDLGILPGHYRRQVLVPNEKWESGHHAWEAAPDLSYYAFRYELEWKDQLYCDVSFSTLAANQHLVRCEFFNQTDVYQNTMLHYAAYLNFPPVRTYSDEPIRMMDVRLPEGAQWVDALDYEELQFATPRHTDTLVYDGMLRGEIRAHGLVNGSGIGMGFGQEAGDWVSFRFTLPQAISSAALLLRCRAPAGARLTAQGAAHGEIELSAQEGFAVFTLPAGALAQGEQTLRLESLGEGWIELDGFAIVPAALAGQVEFQPHIWEPRPEIIEGPRPASLILKYPDVDVYYGLAWNSEDYKIREILNDELDRFLRQMVHEHVQTVLRGPGQGLGHFTNVFIRPIALEPHSSAVVYGLACSGTQPEVGAALAAFPLDGAGLEDAYIQNKARAVKLDTNPHGEPMRFSQERMAATTLLNVVYPVYTRRTFIRHSTPGKWWDCLYTWDSGFIGLGLLEIDIQRAVDSLNAYVTDPGDPQAAFMHHGSFVPVQMYLFKELWNRTQDRALLEYFYPRMRQYYLFLAGRSGSSTTRSLKSNLLKTWNYFYNSGGWDDYPPQVYIHHQALEDCVSPVVTTSQAIRSAKILRSAALALGADQDLALYEEDIATFTQALQAHAWDEEAGYFSYVLHDAQGRPTSRLYYDPDGPQRANYNMGMDGASPLYAGATNPQQEARLLSHMFSPQHMWTRIGMSTVDQSAPYYRKDGYWNGAVWMAHQWFFWKALLDLNHGERAHQVGKTALALWKNEVEESYYCFEHFIVQSGRGAGWHQFSALSTPVLSWFGAYHRPGRLTTGLDVWVESCDFSDHRHSLEASLRLDGPAGRPTTLLASLEAGPAYHVLWNGQEISHQELYPGTLQIEAPYAAHGQLKIQTR